MFQVFGIVLALGSCCILSVSGLVFSPASAPAEHWFAYLSGDRFETAIATLLLVVSLVGGLGLAGTGIGMQSARPRSGGAAMAVSGAVAVCCAIVVVARIMHGSPIVSLLAPAVIAAAGIVLFLLAGHSRQILRRYPAPLDQNVVDDEFLEAYRRRRRH